MKNKLLLGITIFLFLSGTLGLSNAAVFDYDFGTMGYLEDQRLENTTLDFATFTSETEDLHYTSSDGAGLYAGYGGTGDTYIAFSQAVNWLSFTAGDGGGDYDAFAVSLYEFGSKDFLGTFNTPVFGGPNVPDWYTLEIPFANIGSVVFDPANSGVLPGSATGSGGVIITDFSYNTAAVPVPATMVLLGMGLIGLTGARRKLKK